MVGGKLRIVALGGGTGLSTLLRGLKALPVDITAIVTVSDDGGSSGRLRGQLGILPPGDIRNCLVALAEAEPLMQELFQYRFPAGSDLADHNLGNLLMAALTHMTGDFEEAVALCSRVLKIRGQVLPATLIPVVLGAVLTDGLTVRGETQVTRFGTRVERLFLDPGDAPALPQAVEALARADGIVLGPGSLYTSVLPPLLVEDLATAIRDARGLRIYVVNVMTQPGETDGYSAADHLRVLQAQAGPGLVDVVVLNVQRPQPDKLERYLEQGACPVLADARNIQEMGVRTVAARLLSADDYLRHAPDRLARLVAGLVNKNRRQMAH